MDILQKLDKRAAALAQRESQIKDEMKLYSTLSSAMQQQEKLQQSYFASRKRQIDNRKELLQNEIGNVQHQQQLRQSLLDQRIAQLENELSIYDNFLLAKRNCQAKQLECNNREHKLLMQQDDLQQKFVKIKIKQLQADSKFLEGQEELLSKKLKLADCHHSLENNRINFTQSIVAQRVSTMQQQFTQLEQHQSYYDNVIKQGQMLMQEMQQLSQQMQQFNETADSELEDSLKRRMEIVQKEEELKTKEQELIADQLQRAQLQHQQQLKQQKDEIATVQQQQQQQRQQQQQQQQQQQHRIQLQQEEMKLRKNDFAIAQNRLTLFSQKQKILGDLLADVEHHLMHRQKDQHERAIVTMRRQEQLLKQSDAIEEIMNDYQDFVMQKKSNDLKRRQKQLDENYEHVQELLQFDQEAEDADVREENLMVASEQLLQNQQEFENQLQLLAQQFQA